MTDPPGSDGKRCECECGCSFDEVWCFCVREQCSCLDPIRDISGSE